MRKSFLVLLVLAALSLLASVGNLFYRGAGDMSTCVDDGNIVDVHKGPGGKLFGTLLVVRGPNQPAPPGYDVKCKRNDGQFAYYQSAQT